jgi:hypothetical protein
MIDNALEELADVPHWQPLLSAYRERQLAERAANPEHEGWIPRIRSLIETDGEQLSQLHGRLIAVGLLKFELGDITSGMSYQLSSLGIRALSMSEDTAADVAIEPQLESDDERAAAA